ncbi:MAG: hypothetical protein GWM90_14100, partial [Gemmatimonadetes bacterium]|nr:hypothetical protein [Gemmatimonadota bacterium]NIQ55271.1 hypothetical protein [Gemmatimonadota bacterium]NIU75472.1 hypothetical protein [Gammaproteobacteria bacterium]NIX45200.1 hypothetical protein [Gemmatimonadota bacterium]NIY09456.1 hypothetical protein [Gemmatimonadota bacterium]
MRALGVALSLSALVPAATEGQSVRSAVGRDTIRVGDVVPIALRITVDRDARVAWPDTLPLAGTELENAARVRERVDTLEDGR